MPATPQQLAAIQATISQIAQQAAALQTRIATEGITTAGGQVLVPPTAPPPTPPPIAPPAALPPVAPIAPAGQITTPTTATETAIMDRIVNWVSLFKPDYPENLPWKTREEMIEIGVRDFGEPYRQFIIDTIYRELRAPAEGEPAYVPPSWPVYLGTSEEARKKEAERKLEEKKKRLEEEKEKDEELVRLARQKEIRDLRIELGLDPDTGQPLTRPVLPTFTSDFDALRSEYGLEGIESQINALSAEMRDREAALRQGLYLEEGKLRPMELIGARQREITRQAQEAMDELTRRKAVLVDEYNTKASLINTTMKLKEMDYNAAVADYNSRFNEQIALLNVIEARATREEQEENRERDDARANLTVIQNLIIESGKTWDELDPDFQALIKKEEIKAGLPQGITQAFLNEKPDAQLLTIATGTDAEGRQIVTFIYKDKDGMPGVVKTVVTEAFKKTEAEIKAEKETAEFDMARQFIDDNPDASYEMLYTYIDQYTEVLSPAQIKAVLEEKGKKAVGKQYLTRDYFEKIWTPDQLVKAGKEAGFGGIGRGKTGIIRLYLDYLMEYVETRREAGASDDDIFKELT